jgi:2-phospho-L-lactate guanylyltransferase
MVRLLERALSAVIAAAPAGAVVVASDPPAVEVAKRWGLETLPDGGAGPNVALSAAARVLADRGAAFLAVVAADLPLVDAAAVHGLLRKARRDRLAIAPDRLGVGTNALAYAAADFPLCFGPGSFARHSAAARALGWEVAVFHTPGLAVDLDSGDDLDLVAGFAPPSAGSYNRHSRPRREPEFP